MDNKTSKGVDRKFRKRKVSFTEALKEKYCVEDEGTFDFIIVSPRKRNNAAELAHLRTVVLNEMNVTRADIPRQGLTSLCPNVVDLDLANNLLEQWSELLSILSHLPKLKYVNASRNRLRLDTDPCPDNCKLSVENLALNDTDTTIDEVVRLSKIMPSLKELHLCGNNYESLAEIEERIKEGAFSTLECLRLNNNNLTSWSEIWKLRHLPHLKYLILSGNPMQDIFYQHDATCTECDDTKQSDKQTRSTNVCDQGSCEESDGEIQSNDCEDCEADDDSNGSDVCDTYPMEDISLLPTDNMDVLMDGYDKGPLAESELHSKFETSDQTSELLTNEKKNEIRDDDDTDDGVNDELFVGADEFEDGDGSFGNDDDASPRPVSRFGHHDDTISDGSESDLEDEQEDEEDRSRVKAVGSSSSVGIQIPARKSNKYRSSHSRNLNNSNQSKRDRALMFQDDEIFVSGDVSVLAENATVSSNYNYGNEDDEDWPRMAAQTFLNDLINNLKFPDDIPTLHSSNSAVGTVTTPYLVAPDSMLTGDIEAASETTNLEARDSFKALPCASSLLQNSTVKDSLSQQGTNSKAKVDINQNANGDKVDSTSKRAEQEEGGYRIPVDCLSILEAEQRMSNDNEENLFAKIYTDSDFIPRAVSSSGETLGAHDTQCPRFPDTFNFDSFTPDRSKARRSLFSDHNSSATEPAGDKSVTSRHHMKPMFPNFFQSCFQNLLQAESDSCSDCEAEQHNRVGNPRGQSSKLSKARGKQNADHGIRQFDSGDHVTASSRNCNATSDQCASSSNDTVAEQKNVTDNIVPKSVVEQLNTKPNFSVSSSRTYSHNDASRDSTETMLPVQAKEAENSCSQRGSQESDTAVSSCPTCKLRSTSRPFHQLQMLCLSNAGLSHSDHLKAFMAFPKLSNVRLKNNPLYQAAGSDDKRKLYIASLPKVNILNGSEVSQTEREKAERFFLRYFMDRDEKPEFYHWLVKKHGPPVKLVDIDLGAGYQEWANLRFVYDGKVQFCRKIHLVEPVARLRDIIAMKLAVPKRCFIMYHHSCGPSHPESERELIELRCENLPMSRFDFAEGDEIHIDVRG